MLIVDPSTPICLPWPPSANRYWRHVGNRVLISKEAKLYKFHIQRLALTWRVKGLTGRISLQIQAFPPDKRARDIDNLIKITLDSLQDAGVFVNDSQIDKITIERMPIRKNGELIILIQEM